jgi:hypothetical protein
MSGPKCIRCERTGQVLSGRWQYQPHGNPKALIFPLCGQCMIAVTNSGKAAKKLAAKVEALIPDFEVIDGGAVMPIFGPRRPVGRAE